MCGHDGIAGWNRKVEKNQHLKMKELTHSSTICEVLEEDEKAV
jgi:hypothetical protein